MWIVKLALRSPYTFLSLAAGILVVGVLVLIRVPIDVFPEINVPVVSVIWAYPGLPGPQMQDRIGSAAERAYTAYVNDIEHTETQSIAGICLIKVFFQPHARIDAAVSQLSATSQFLLRVLPPGLSPPVIIRYNASSVPILQLAVNGSRYSEGQLYDYAVSVIRPQLATEKGATVLVPLGGKAPQISVDLDLRALAARRLSPSDVLEAVNVQNLILPSGVFRSGTTEYAVSLNANPEVVQALNDLPLSTTHGHSIRLRDVGYVHEGAATQTNIVRVDGRRSILIPVLKGAGASTLNIVAAVRKALPKIADTLPDDISIKILGDQSIIVRSAIRTVLVEAILSVALASLAVFLFLGSWRGTLVASLSIPLSAVTSVIALYALGYTLNVMTLGGLSLAVGMLVDDATVELENIHRHRRQGKSILRSILDGAQEIALPTLASTLAICLAFVPVVFLSGAARFLFTPLALGAVFAMVASYLISRTVVPTLTRFLLRHETPASTGNVLSSLHRGWERRFGLFQAAYRAFLSSTMAGGGMFIVLAMCACTAGLLCLGSRTGRDLFPAVAAGQIRLHVRAEPGTRLESTEELFQDVEHTIRAVIPPAQIDTVVANFGIPVLPVSLAFTDTPTISSSDGEILVSLRPGLQRHGRSHVAALRQRLQQQFPGITIFFQPGDMVNQILNFGLPAPIDVQVVGRDQDAASHLAQDIADRLRGVPGLADVYVHQVHSAPAIRVDVDRVKASEFGITERDVAQGVLIALSSSGIVYPNYWLNPRNGLTYLLAVQAQPRSLEYADQLRAIPVTGRAREGFQLLGNVARTASSRAPVNVSHYGVMPVVDIFANAANTDLFHATAAVQRIIADSATRLPRGTSVAMRGQTQILQESFRRLGYGFALSLLLIFLLLVMTFQSLRDAGIVLLVVPGAIAGALFGLMATHTPLSIPGLLGGLMSVGVGTANAILLITFARQRLSTGTDSFHAALQASVVRLRPILMTTCAMLCGMLPMALGLGEGAEQNAPLGRAAFGGLLGASLNVLFIVPIAFAALHRRHRQPIAEPDSELLDG